MVIRSLPASLLLATTALLVLRRAGGTLMEATAGVQQPIITKTTLHLPCTLEDFMIIGGSSQFTTLIFTPHFQ